MISLKNTDPTIASAIEQDNQRQRYRINLIASENYTSKAVLDAQCSLLTNKYAEGYPGNRYYGGCQNVDTVETLAIDRAKKLFEADHVNVQAHSGAQANMAAYFTLLKPGDTVLAMSLAHGGHLTHGFSGNLSGQFYVPSFYSCSPDTGLLDYDAVAVLARQVRPALLIAGGSFYTRVIDFAACKQIAEEVGELLMVDMAHLAGLVVAGLFPSPVPHADVSTATTHKTLRGPRGGIILCRQELAERIDNAVFPGSQGGPQQHAIAGKAVCFKEAASPEFAAYQEQAVRNAQALARNLEEKGMRIVTGGTDTHMVVVDLRDMNITGEEAERVLERAHICVTKAPVPGAAGHAGLRFGTLAVTAEGMVESDMQELSSVIIQALAQRADAARLEAIGTRVAELSAEHRGYPREFGGYCRRLGRNVR